MGNEFTEDGWTGLGKKAEKMTKEDNALAAYAQFELDSKYAAVFAAGMGAEVLKHLRDQTIEQPSFLPAVGLHPKYQGFLREGQNSLIRDIEKRIARARLGPPPEPDFLKT